MTRRGLAATDLARRAKVSPQTVGAALAGRPIAMMSLRRIAEALAAVPYVPGMDLLLGSEHADGPEVR